MRSLDAVGVPLAGSAIQLRAAAKITVVGPHCEVSYVAIPTFDWTVVEQPSGGGAELEQTSTLTPTLRLASPGEYRVRFVACPSGCTAPGSLQVDSAARELRVVAVERAARPPESVPILPPSALIPSPPHDAPAGCVPFGGGFLGPEWVTVERWRGSEDYRLLEGFVSWSHVSGSDNPLVHRTNDQDFFVVPDPKFGDLLDPINTEKMGMQAEWERPFIPSRFWPTPGDRVSVFGYWIHDCGHRQKGRFLTEIHPPVGVAVQRPRTVEIPASNTFDLGGVAASVGSGVSVPGIVSDVWFNRRSGLATSCRAQALHQPSHPRTCIRGPSPLDHAFHFNIYLPRDPQAVMAAAGFDVPPVPLYLDVQGTGGPDPLIERVREGDVTYLRVTIDLRGFSGDEYRRRILAAWVYPSPDNWGLRGWRLRVTSLRVIRDGDRFSDGDWRFWIGTNNRDSEWTPLLDCNECVRTGVLTRARVGKKVLTAPWQTGAVLGPDLRLFPSQRIWVYSGGYEQDPVVSLGGTGTVADQREQSAGVFTTREQGSTNPDYELNYDISNIALSPPSLSVAARRLYEAYVVDAATLGVRTLPPPVATPPLDPVDLPVSGRPAPLSASDLFGEQECEEQAFQCLGMKQLAQGLRAATRNPREVPVVRRLLTHLRETLCSMARSGLSRDVRLYWQQLLPTLQRALPPKLVQRSFGATAVRAGTVLC